MMEELLRDSEVSVTIISEYRYEEIIKDKKVNIKGKSNYENYWLVELLPRKREFYVLEDFYRSYENGGDDWEFTIVTKYKGLHFIISSWGGN